MMKISGHRQLSVMGLFSLRIQGSFLLVAPSQLQFTPNPQIADQQSLIEQKVGGIVGLLPHTPFTAIGLNFAWSVNDDGVTTRRLTRELFFKDNGPLHRRFDTEDAQFGAYFSRDFRGCREKLDIKPVTFADKNQGLMHALLLAFNFHRILVESDESVAVIREMLGLWDEFREESKQAAESLREEGVK